MGLKPKVKRFDIYLICLDPTVGSELKATRPCVIISPDEMNRYLRTVIIAHMRTQSKEYPTRVELRFQQKKRQIALDQIRVIDKNRLIKKVGQLNEETSFEVLSVLKEMFD